MAVDSVIERINKRCEEAVSLIERPEAPRLKKVVRKTDEEDFLSAPAYLTCCDAAKSSTHIDRNRP